MAPTTFPAHVYARRLGEVGRAVVDKRLGGVVIGTGPELAYLTGSWADTHERLTALVVGPGGQARLVVPSTDAGSVSVPGVDIVGWRDGENPYALVAAVLGEGPVGLGSSLTADHVLRLQEHAGPTVLAAAALEGVLTAKDPAEIGQLREAASAIDRVHAQVPGLLAPGRTENEVARDIEELILAGHDTVDFVIVGSGPNGANPHHEHSDRELRPGDPVVVDIGGSLGAGYHSDCTRTYQVGVTEDADFLRAYSVLQRAQDEAVRAARPGMRAGELDAVARGVIESAGYGGYFTHRLGHGIGLALHEAPFLAPGEEMVLREGMAFSIEPGIYVPGKWGMRIEDIVVLGPDGAQRLNSAPRHLR
ncbi:M24 family metallopeptidase [Corynebacterium sp. UBA2622]|uniref:M24 family metallopeptidase n=1 Tax=Corynebacterium sp. UBA2622 TaxID=1946393 RepID=UPI0025B9F6B1|nr:Xaa-Pro peptidase family protein [Corynebacterium sp. UBA2622]